MKGLIASLTLAAITFTGSIYGKCCCHPEDYSFYVKVGSGVSCSESASVNAPSDTWTPAIQGYNSKLGNRAIGALAIGCELMKIVDLDVGISTRSTFKYRKNQTPIGSDFTYTREFDLDVTPILFTATFLAKDFDCLNWNIACGTIYPIIGVGVGVSNLTITNFRTTGLPPTGDSFPYPSFASENQHTRHHNFTYTAQLGLEYNYNDCWTIATGYRWFDAGKFKGPRYLRTSPGGSVDVDGNEWKMRFRSNEWFIELKIFL